MKTRLLFLPDDRTVLELETFQDADDLVQKVRSGLWTPPANYRPRYASPVWRAIRQGQRVIILPWEEPPAAGLTARQVEVIAGLAQGMTLKQLAVHMGISLRTICEHITLIKKRLGTSTLAQTISRAAELGIFPPRD